MCHLTAQGCQLHGSPSHHETDHCNPRWTHTLPLKPTIWDYLAFPILSFCAWVRLLCDNFDWRFITMVVCGQHLLKGMLAGGGNTGGLLVVEGLIYMRLRVGASAKTIYQAIGSSAWGLKPLYALISDAVNIGGYRRTPWVIFTAVVATLAYLTLVLEGDHLSGMMVCACFFFAKLQLSWTDLMVEATYTEKMREAPKYSPDIVSFAWSGVGFFAMIGIVVAGPGIALIGPTGVLALAIPIAFFVVLPASKGFMTEKSLPKHEKRLQLDHVRQNWNYFLCTICLTLGVICMVAAGLLGVDPATQVLMAATVCFVTGASSVALLPTAVWRPLLYMFLANVLLLDMSGFTDNFYLDQATREEAQRLGYPICTECPHFSPTFYYTVMGLADSGFMLLGSFLFSKYMAKWSYRRALYVSQALNIAASLLDIMQYQRVNLALGLPDWVFMLGKASLQNSTAMMNAMPTNILMSKICPRGIEASVFALLAGFSNLGTTVASYFGAYVLTLTGMDHVGKGMVDDFSGAWKVCLIGAVFSSLTLLLIPVFIPDVSMQEEVHIEEERAIDDEEGVPLLPHGAAPGLPVYSTSV